jgi:putative transposase
VPTECEIRSYEVAYVLQLLHLDFHEGSRKILTRTGERITPLLVAFIDDHSRFMAHAVSFRHGCLTRRRPML